MIEKNISKETEVDRLSCSCVAVCECEAIRLEIIAPVGLVLCHFWNFCIRIPGLRTDLTVCPYDPMRQIFETETRCGRRNFGGQKKNHKNARAGGWRRPRAARGDARDDEKHTVRVCISRRALTHRPSPRMNQPDIRPRRPARARQSPRISIMRRCYLHSGRDPRNIPKQDALAVP